MDPGKSTPFEGTKASLLERIEEIRVSAAGSAVGRVLIGNAIRLEGVERTFARGDIIDSILVMMVVSEEP